MLKPKKKQKPRFAKLGYGALALYAAGIVVMAGGVYGVNLSTLMEKWNAAERIRAQMKTGRMVITARDRFECRSYHFDNETSAVGAETVAECDEQPLRPVTKAAPNDSFGAIRDGFNNR